MTSIRDAYCSSCGTAFAQPLVYPRTCARCGMQVWANPLPVVVAIVPVREGARVGVLVVRRAIPPAVGKLALVGGFLETGETWQQGAAREVREEAGAIIDPAALDPFWYVSTETRTRVLLFSVASEIDVSALPAFTADHECSERGLVFGVDGLAAELAFPLHVEALRRYFSARGVAGPHAYVAR